ncbi:MAG: U32 family peptidase [Anaeroplasmataceae bacterium]|nr:U32 family peptidase [Anaeroplasmataceae bacterium]
MRLVCRLSDIGKLNEVASYVDAILLDDGVTIEKDIALVAELGLLPIYNLCEMIFPSMLKEYKSKIMRTRDLGCYYYITDIGLAHILKAMGLIERTIYDPITMITNRLDAKIYQEYGFASIGLSNEITLADTRQMIVSAEIKAFLQVFGYRGMLHTRRRLVTLYQNKIEASFPMNHLTIEEATRKDTFPIVENSLGTKIYRSHIICLLNELNKINLEYAYMDGFGIQDETFIEVLRLFDAVRKGKNKKTAVEALDSLNLPVHDGFAYQDSIYVKEEF